jgi:hypothetical protein
MKPVKTGTALHEQNGVAIPIPAAIPCPLIELTFSICARTFSASIYERRKTAAVVIAARRHKSPIEWEIKNARESAAFELSPVNLDSKNEPNQ